jgi:hypothetical protein
MSNDFSEHHSANKVNTLLTTDTGMMPEYLANEDKLITEDRRWYRDDENEDDDLDDDVNNYLNGAKKTVAFEANNPTFIKKDTKQSADQHTDSDSATGSATGTNKDTDKDTTKDTTKDTKDKDPNDEKNLSAEELMLRKLDILRKLVELAQAGVKLSQNYTIHSDYKTMKYEYELHKNIRARQNGINWMSSMSLNCIWGLEMLNDKYDPFSLKLKGWSEQMNADINNYYDVFGELYEKYNQPGKNMAPELKILLMISGSALKFHLTNSMLGNLPTMNDKIYENPELAERLRQKAVTDKIIEQQHKQNDSLNKQMSKEHEIASQKVSDIQMLKNKEIEHLNMQQSMLQKQAEIENLRNSLLMDRKNTVAQPNSSQETLKMSPIMQKMMEQKMMEQNNTIQNNTIQQQNQMQQAIQNQQIMTQQQQIEFYKKQMEMMESQKKSIELKLKQEHIQELERIKENKRKEEEYRRDEQRREEQRRSDKRTSSATSKTSKTSKNSKLSKLSMNSDDSSTSRVTVNANLDNILMQSKRDIEKNNSDEQRITPIETMDYDDISVGSKGSKGSKSKQSKMSVNGGHIKPKKTGISISF